jgi:superfamily I DNA/RNA helicase
MARKRKTADASIDFGPVPVAITPAKNRKRKTATEHSTLVLDTIDRLTKKTGRAPTSFQVNIYQWLLEGRGHAVVNAVAGSGKTSTLIDACAALTYGGKRPNILLLAFNKVIAEELTARISLPNCTAKTLNSLGAGIVFKNATVKPTLNDSKTDFVAKGVVGYDMLNRKDEIEFSLMLPPIRRLVALFKGFGYGAIRGLPTRADVMELCDRYDIDIPDPKEVSTDKFFDVLLRTYEDGFNCETMIDFNDQLLLPIAKNMAFPTYYQYVFIDESQDLNPIQVEMIRRLTANGGRAVFVGDRNQAIYGFRGADPEAIDSVVRDFSAVELPLSICWRCPSKVIEAAQEIVPHIQASPTAKPGTVENVKEDDFMKNVKDGDMVICRTTAPLAEHCMALIRNGVKATIRGSDIGKNLCSLLDKIGREQKNGDVWERIDAWGNREIAKLAKPGQEAKSQRLADRIDTLKVLAEGCENINDVKNKILSIFSDKTTGVVLSTIHRVKGLESERVWILHPELLPHPMAKKSWARKQESNLIYVAITRATSELYWVEPKPKRNGTTEEQLTQR